MTGFREFPFTRAGELATAMLREVYESAQLVPSARPEIHAIPDEGEGMEGFADALRGIAQGSAGLAAPGALGHMDTAPHPAAAFAEALVSAANNNLLFRELSPLASHVEERMLDELAARLGLSAEWARTFVSGGSLANLTALFAAFGGFEDAAERSQCALFAPECAHLSVKKAAAVLGIPTERVHRVASDELGRADPSALDAALRGSSARRKAVVATLGSTVHGRGRERRDARPGLLGALRLALGDRVSEGPRTLRAHARNRAAVLGERRTAPGTLGPARLSARRRGHPVGRPALRRRPRPRRAGRPGDRPGEVVLEDAVAGRGIGAAAQP